MLSLNSSLNQAPANVKNIYLMGIGGVAMGALAVALKNAGFNVRGSDNPLYPPMSTFLEDRRIDVAIGYAAANLSAPPRPDLVIVGNVMRRDNPEALELDRLHIPYLSLPQALRHFFIKDNLSLVVAGTHGKTTTTALLASALKQAGYNTGYMVGGLVGNNMGNFAACEPTSQGCFVTEGDEYDTAFFDKRPKFVHYVPRVGILTSCEFDHADIYPDFNAVRRSFDMFTQSVSDVLVVWGDSDEVMDRADTSKARVETYGWGRHNRWQLVKLSPASNGGMDIEFITPEQKVFQVFTPLVGEHNALNVLACLAALHSLGMDLTKAIQAQALFPGVARRLQIRGRIGGITVVDDFAHHPTAVHETIKAVAGFGLPGWNPEQGRLIAIFEPRSNTSRSRIFQKDYAAAFNEAQMVFLQQPASSQDIKAEDLFSAQELAADLSGQGINAHAFANSAELLAALLNELKPGDLCLIMSNGSFDNIHQRLLSSLNAATMNGFVCCQPEKKT